MATLAPTCEHESPAPSVEEAGLSCSEDVLLVEDVAKLLRLTNTKTVYKLVDAGVIPYTRIGRRLRFLRSSLLAWLADQERTPGRKRR